MSAKWAEGESKKYKGVTISNADQLSEETIRRLIKTESKGKWRFFAMAVFFGILSFAILFLGIDELNKKLTLEIANAFSFRGNMAGLAL